MTIVEAAPGGDRTAHRAHVHVVSLGETFVTDSVSRADGSFTVGVQLPRSHLLWGDRSRRYHDPLVLMEIGRQAVFLVLHEHHGIPVGWKFVLRRVDLRVVDLETFRDDRVAPPEGAIDGTLTVTPTTHGIVEVSFSGGAVIAGREAMVMSADITVVTPYNFALLRARGRGRRPLDSPPPPPPGPALAPGEVDRGNPWNVVVSRHPSNGDLGDSGELVYGLIVDESHPAYFDHPHDHVTGSLILELFRQSAVAAATATGALAAPVRVIGCSMGFEQYAELDAEVLSHARVAYVTSTGDTGVALELHQFGEAISHAELLLRSVPEPPPGTGL